MGAVKNTPANGVSWVFQLLAINKIIPRPNITVQIAVPCSRASVIKQPGVHDCYFYAATATRSQLPGYRTIYQTVMPLLSKHTRIIQRFTYWRIQGVSSVIR